MNPMLATANRVVTVVVEYDGPKGRVSKAFTGDRAVGQSRSFYKSKMKDGKNPRVVGASRNGE